MNKSILNEKHLKALDKESLIKLIIELEQQLEEATENLLNVMRNVIERNIDEHWKK